MVRAGAVGVCVVGVCATAAAAERSAAPTRVAAVACDFMTFTSCFRSARRRRVRTDRGSCRGGFPTPPYGQHPCPTTRAPAAPAPPSPPTPPPPQPPHTYTPHASP